MKTYEALVIYSLQAGGEVLQQGKSLFEGLIQKQGGRVLNHIDIGKRYLGYSVRKAREGYCLAFNFELLPDRVELLKQQLGLAEGILKFTLVARQTGKPRHSRYVRKEQTVQTTVTGARG